MWDPNDEDCGEISSLTIENVTTNNYEVDFDTRLMNACIASLRRDYVSDINSDDLSRLWKISLKDAELTLKATTNNSIRLNEGRLSRRYKTEAHQRQYRQLGGYLSQFYSDTFFSGTKSTRGNTCIQLFVNKGNLLNVIQ